MSNFMKYEIKAVQQQIYTNKFKQFMQQTKTKLFCYTSDPGYLDTFFTPSRNKLHVNPL